MVYQIKNNDIETWYASIEEDQNWKITRTKGIDKNHINK